MKIKCTCVYICIGIQINTTVVTSVGRQRRSAPNTVFVVTLANLHSIHQRVLLSTIRGSKRRVRARVLRGARSSQAQRPTRPWLLSYDTVLVILHGCRYESHVSDQPLAWNTGPGCLRETCPSWALQPTRPWLLSSRPAPCMHPDGQYSRCWVARPTSSLHEVYLRGPLLILSSSAYATVAHLFPSSSLPCTRRDDARDAGSFSPPTTTSLTTGVVTHVEGENVPRLTWRGLIEWVNSGLDMCSFRVIFEGLRVFSTFWECYCIHYSDKNVESLLSKSTRFSSVWFGRSQNVVQQNWSLHFHE